MAAIDFVIAGIPILLSMLIPGALLALPMLKRSRLGLFEKLMFGLVIGTVIPPFLMYLESLVGIGYSFPMALANLLLVSLAGLAWCARENVLPELSKFSIDLETLGGQLRFAAAAILIVMMLWAFWARMQSFSPIFYEFDPYYYAFSTEYLLKGGDIPLHDFTAWYPEGSTHRLVPMTNYLAAAWYSIYTQGGAYDRDTLTLVSNVYPPLVGALLVFLLYVLLKEEYGMGIGLMGALFAAVLPRFIQKFAAGEAEIQPWGIYAIFFFAAAYALLCYRRDRMLAVLAGIAAISVINGSQYFIIVSLVYGGYIGIQSLLDFLRGRDLREFLELNGIVIAFILFTSLTMAFYLDYPGYGPLDRLISFAAGARQLIIVGPYLFACALWYISSRVHGAENKSYALLGLLLAGLLLMGVTPLGPKVIGYINSAAGFAGYSEALYMTVAEEAPTQGEFVGAFDVLGYSVGGVSLIHLALFLSAAGLCYGAYRDSKLAILFALLIFPISYVGLSKSKYILQLGYMLVLAVAVVFGELMKSLPKLLKGEEAKRNARYAVLALAFLFSAYGFLNPVFASGGLRFDGAAIELMTVSMGPKYWSAGVPNCAEIANGGYATSYYLYCDRIPDYWLDTMTWIREETEPDASILSWWDYGHWTNYFGERNTLTRNEHANSTKDLMVADKFVFGPRDSAESGEADLAQFMRDYHTHYVMMDIDLVSKWGALDFLACVYNNQTNMSYAQKSGIGTSNCEEEHQVERIFIPTSPALADYCQSPDPSVRLIRAQSTLGPVYCISQTGVMVYEDNMTRQNKAIPSGGQRATYSGREYVVYDLLYIKNASMWEDGVSGWADRKGKYYDSNFYKGFILGELSGFDLAYEWKSPDGQRAMMIYRLKDYP